MVAISSVLRNKGNRGSVLWCSSLELKCPRHPAHSRPRCYLCRMGTKVNLALREDASSDDRLQAMFQVRFCAGTIPFYVPKSLFF